MPTEEEIIEMIDRFFGDTKSRTLEETAEGLANIYEHISLLLEAI